MKQLSKNLISLLSADIVRRLLGFVSVAYLARIVGKEEFGAVNIGFAVLAYSMVLGAAGFPMLGTKRIAQGGSSEFIGQMICNRLITGIITLAAVAVVCLIFVKDRGLADLIILFSCAIIPQAFFLDWFYQGKETMGIVSSARVLQAVVYLAAVLIFVGKASDILWVAIGSILGECAASVLLFISFRRKYPDIHLHFRPSLHLLKQSVPLAIGTILATLMMNFPPIALGMFATTADVGIYSAAGKIVYFVMMGDRILLLLLMPAAARKHSRSREELKKMLHDTVKWILIIGLPIAVGGMLVADDLITIVFGAEYIDSAVVFRILIWYFLFTMFHSVFTAGLIGSGGEKSYGKLMTTTALFYLVLAGGGAFLFGPIGAALGVVMAEGLGLLLINRSLRSFVPMSVPGKLLQLFISIILMALCVLWMLQYGLLAAISAGIGSYCLFSMLLGAFNWNDVKSLLVRF